MCLQLGARWALSDPQGELLAYLGILDTKLDICERRCVTL